MKNFFVPYTGRKPASVCINGHRLLILSEQENTMYEGLSFLGADRIKRVRAGETEDEERLIISQLADRIDGGVIITPDGTEIPDILKNLQQQLPWLQ